MKSRGHPGLVCLTVARGGSTVVYLALTGIAPPCRVKLIGTLPIPICPRALTQQALIQTVAPLATVSGNRIWTFGRVASPSK